MSLDLTITSNPCRGKIPLHPDVVVGASEARTHGMESEVFRTAITRWFAAANVTTPRYEAQIVEEIVIEGLCFGVWRWNLGDLLVPLRKFLRG